MLGTLKNPSGPQVPVKWRDAETSRGSPEESRSTVTYMLVFFSLLKVGPRCSGQQGHHWAVLPEDAAVSGIIGRPAMRLRQGRAACLKWSWGSLLCLVAKPAERSGSVPYRLECLLQSGIHIPGDPGALWKQPKGSQNLLTGRWQPRGDPSLMSLLSPQPLLDMMAPSASPCASAGCSTGHGIHARPPASSRGDSATALAWLHLRAGNSPIHRYRPRHSPHAWRARDDFEVPRDTSDSNASLPRPCIPAAPAVFPTQRSHCNPVRCTAQTWEAAVTPPPLPFHCPGKAEVGSQGAYLK